MSRVAVVGGHGKVARHLHPLLIRTGHTPVAVVRNEGYRQELEALGAEGSAARHRDVHVGRVRAGVHRVPGRRVRRWRRTGRQDRAQADGRPRGLTEVDPGARGAGIRRFVQISAIGVDDPVAEDASPVWRAYIEAKRDADEALRTSRFDWTILRSGLLTDTPGTDQVVIGRDVPRGQIPRADVAAVITTVLDNDGAIGRQWALVQGGLPIAEAIEAAVSAENGPHG